MAAILPQNRIRAALLQQQGVGHSSDPLYSGIDGVQSKPNLYLNTFRRINGNIINTSGYRSALLERQDALIDRNQPRSLIKAVEDSHKTAQRDLDLDEQRDIENQRRDMMAVQADTKQEIIIRLMDIMARMQRGSSYNQALSQSTSLYGGSSESINEAVEANAGEGSDIPSYTAQQYKDMIKKSVQASQNQIQTEVYNTMIEFVQRNEWDQLNDYLPPESDLRDIIDENSEESDAAKLLLLIKNQVEALINMVDESNETSTPPANISLVSGDIIDPSQLNTSDISRIIASIIHGSQSNALNLGQIRINPSDILDVIHGQTSNTREELLPMIEAGEAGEAPEIDQDFTNLVFLTMSKKKLLDRTNRRPATHVSYDGDEWRRLYPIYKIYLNSKEPKIAFYVPGITPAIKRKIDVRNPSYKAYRMITVDSISPKYENDILFEKYPKSKVADGAPYKSSFNITQLD